MYIVRKFNGKFLCLSEVGQPYWSHNKALAIEVDSEEDVMAIIGFKTPAYKLVKI
jgi:hypothetical protein